MLQTPETIKGVKGITDQQRDRIKAFLQGAVYCLCNSSHKHDWFSVRDFLGGENYYWQDTPLSALYEYYMACSDQDIDYAFSEAAKAAGRLMKAVLQEDKRIFEAREGFAKSYRWTGEDVDGKC